MIPNSNYIVTYTTGEAGSRDAGVVLQSRSIDFQRNRKLHQRTGEYIWQDFRILSDRSRSRSI